MAATGHTNHPNLLTRAQSSHWHLVPEEALATIICTYQDQRNLISDTQPSLSYPITCITEHGTIAVRRCSLAPPERLAAPSSLFYPIARPAVEPHREQAGLVPGPARPHGSHPHNHPNHQLLGHRHEQANTLERPTTAGTPPPPSLRPVAPVPIRSAPAGPAAGPPCRQRRS